MTQFIFEHSDALTNFINDSQDISQIIDMHSEEQKIQIKSINLERLNKIILHTTLPQVLIEIIDSYVNDKINLYVSRHFQYQDPEQRLHVHFVCHINDASIDFDTYIFNEVCCCIKFKHNEINNGYSSSLNFHHYNHYTYAHNTIECYEYKTFTYNLVLVNRYEYKYQDARLKEIFENHDKHFCKCKNPCDPNYVQDCHSLDLNLFFNCYSKNSQQLNNEIKHDSPSIKIQNDESYVVENCKYYNDSEYYKQARVTPYTTKLAQFKIINHVKLTNTIAIYKLLFETINTQMKQICDDHEKVQQLIDYVIKHN